MSFSLLFPFLFSRGKSLTHDAAKLDQRTDGREAKRENCTPFSTYWTCFQSLFDVTTTTTTMTTPTLIGPFFFCCNFIIKQKWEAFDYWIQSAKRKDFRCLVLAFHYSSWKLVVIKLMHNISLIRMKRDDHLCHCAWANGRIESHAERRHQFLIEREIDHRARIVNNNREKQTADNTCWSTVCRGRTTTKQSIKKKEEEGEECGIRTSNHFLFFIHSFALTMGQGGEFVGTDNLSLSSILLFLMEISLKTRFLLLLYFM